MRQALARPLENIDPGVPDTLQQMLEIQFERLHVTEQAVLKSASVAGDRFSAWGISESLNMEPTDVEAVCEMLVERQQFIKQAGIHEFSSEIVSSTYEFRHSLYRHAIYKRISDIVRSTLHRKVGERLESLCTSDVEDYECAQIHNLYSQGQQEFASELALHFEHGRVYEKAIEYLLLTARNADRRFAQRDSISILQHALELVPRLASGIRAETEIKILDRLGDAHYALGEMENSARVYQVEADRATQGGLKGAHVHALIALARPAGFIEPDGAITFCDKAVEVGASQDDLVLQARARLLAASTRLLYLGWRKEDADVCAAAKQRIRDQGTSSLSGEEVLYAHVLTFEGNYAEVLRWVGEDISNMAETPSMVLYPALTARGIALAHLSQLGEALRIVRMGQRIAERNGNDPWCTIFRCREAWLRMTLFDFEGARQLCATTMRSRGEWGQDSQRKTVAKLYSGQTELALGRHQQALLYFKQILDQPLHPRYFLQWYWRMNAQLGAANAWLARGDTATAHHEIDLSLAAVLSTADPVMQTMAWESKARVAIAEEDLASAADCVNNAQTILEKFDIPNPAWRLHATAHDLFTQAGKKEEAERHRSRAETVIWCLANSLPEDEPLRATFLAAEPVRRILGGAS